MLRQRYGRPQGRPQGKDSANPNHFWDSKRVRDHAAKIVGLGTYDKANRAKYVFEHGDQVLRAAVNDGTVSVNTAYKKVQKKTKGATATKTETEDMGRSAEAEQETGAGDSGTSAGSTATNGVSDDDTGRET